MDRSFKSSNVKFTYLSEDVLFIFMSAKPGKSLGPIEMYKGVSLDLGGLGYVSEG